VRRFAGQSGANRTDRPDKYKVQEARSKKQEARRLSAGSRQSDPVFAGLAVRDLITVNSAVHQGGIILSYNSTRSLH